MAVACCLLLALLVPTELVAEVDKITVEMNETEAVSILKRHDAVDITPNLAVVGPGGEHPLKGLYWKLEAYGVVLQIASSADGKLQKMFYWSAADFEHSKDRRAKTRIEITEITLDGEARRGSFRKKVTGE